LENAEFIKFIDQYNFVCLTETFTSNTKFDKVFKNHDSYCSKAKKLSRQGRLSGGVMILSDKCLSKYVHQINTDVENIIILKVLKELFGTDKDVLLMGLYIPPYDSKYWKVTENGFGLEVLEKCMLDLEINIDNFHLMMFGDFNARTANHNIDFSLSDDLTCDDIDSLMKLVQRKSEDTIMNQFGEQVLELCNIFDCVILNGLSKLNCDDNCTYIAENGSSLVDYFVVSFEMFHKLQNKCLIVRDIIESDHFPVELCLQANEDVLFEQKRDTQKRNKIKKLVWQKDKECSFKQNLNSTESLTKLNDANQIIDENVNVAIDIFNDCLKSAAECMNKNISSKKNNNAIWFDEECKQAKHISRKCLKMFRKKRDEENRHCYIQSRKSYKSLVKQKKREYKKNLAEQLKKK
jgi:exonuclease III